MDDYKTWIGKFGKCIFQLSGVGVVCIRGEKLWAPIEHQKYLSEIFEFIVCQQTLQICP